MNFEPNGDKHSLNLICL